MREYDTRTLAAQERLATAIESLTAALVLATSIFEGLISEGKSLRTITATEAATTTTTSTTTPGD